jgi:hypothetical protein
VSETCSVVSYFPSYDNRNVCIIVCVCVTWVCCCCVCGCAACFYIASLVNVRNQSCYVVASVAIRVICIVLIFQKSRCECVYDLC